MKRILIAGVAGGIVLYIWGIVSFHFLPWHAMGRLPGETAITQAMRAADVPAGVYRLPGRDREAMQKMTEAEREKVQAEWKAAHEQGPLAVIVYDAEGASTLPVMAMVRGLVLDVLLAAVAAAILSMAAPALGGLPTRILFLVLVGIYASIATHLMNWNWMGFPLGFSLEMACDTVVGSLLLGIVLAIVVRPDGFDREEYDEVSAG